MSKQFSGGMMSIALLVEVGLTLQAHIMAQCACHMWEPRAAGAPSRSAVGRSLSAPRSSPSSPEPAASE
jgi:hypothetical protein